MKARLFLFALALSTIGIHCVAQESRFLQQETDSIGNITFAKVNTETSPQSISLSVELLKSMYSKRGTDEFKLSERRKEIRDEQGHTHRYYQQYYKNVKVEDGEATVHSDKQGNIETVFGYFKLVGEVNVTPTLLEAQALEYALKHIGAETYKWQIPEEEQWIKEYYNDTYYPMGELVIVRDQLKTDRIYRLAYRFDIYAHKPMSRNYVWVDAITGDILNMASRIVFANAAGTAVTRYSGSRSITTDSYNGRYRLRETRNGVSISTLNMNHGGVYSYSSDFTDNDNNWTTAEHSTNNNNAALDAHWGAEMTYEYFKQVHLRNSWNHSNGPLFSYVNANLGSGRNSDNAFWDGEKMTYGQGFLLPPLTTLDICAHEIGHGVFQSEVNYTSSTDEFGAINESLSDIWAACVENWATNNKQTWLCGEDLGSVFRSMSNPNAFGQPDTYGGTYWFNTTGCIPNPQTNDNCGVHYNSGIMNYWFYLLAVGGSGINDNGDSYNVTGIGIEKAAKIVYRAETVYMTAYETFSLARTHTIQAAIDYGYCSQEVRSVIDAWHAVGVSSPFHALEANLCTTIHKLNAVSYLPTVYNHQSLGKIYLDCDLSDQDITEINLESATEIVLLPGFKFSNGTFTAKVVPCNISNNSMQAIKREQTVDFETDRITFAETKPDSNPFIADAVIYPNPTDNIVNIDWKGKFGEAKNIAVYNLSGLLLFEKPVVSQSERLDMQAYPNGVYTIKLLFKDGTADYRKIILTR